MNLLVNNIFSLLPTEIIYFTLTILKKLNPLGTQTKECALVTNKNLKIKPKIGLKSLIGPNIELKALQLIFLLNFLLTNKFYI